MFRKLIIKIYEVRYSYYKKMINWSLEEAKAYTFDEDQTLHKKCMNRATKYIKKLDRLSKRVNKILYG